jgi:adenosylmethionine-8-amino-7-oxononanoate aminotransferase
MMTSSALEKRDLKHIWHPCSQMKDYELFPPLPVKKAYGSYIELNNGDKIIDAISSWWCKSLGHCHPRLQNALIQQMNQFEHVILANTTNETITVLSEKLAKLMPSLNKIFYAGDGSSAIEIAMKLSLHSRQIAGDLKKTKFIALNNGYHGDTTAALSVSDLGIYKNPYQSMLFEAFFIPPPYIYSIHESLWSDCSEHWLSIEKILEEQAETTTAIVLEPIVQGAGGMKIYSQDFLKRLRAWSYKNNIHLIADEIMTGMGRTGKMLACEHANIEPDFLCLGKGLTAGWLPFSAVLMRDNIYRIFYSDYHKGDSFLHSHTYSGNVLAASVAIEAFTIMEELKLVEQANQLGKLMLAAMQDIAHNTQKIYNIRQIGAIVAADLISPDPARRYGFEVYRKAVKLGALLRPLGNTIYWLPPLTTDIETIENLKIITEKAIDSVHF